ncbi:hypothetical protein KEM52_004174, partial [Ascosphaera acerosa]
MVGLGAAPAVLQLALVSVLPETPRWLVRAERERDARAVLGRVYGERERRDGVRVADRVLREIERDIAAEEEELRLLAGSRRKPGHYHEENDADDRSGPAAASPSSSSSSSQPIATPTATAAWKDSWSALLCIAGNRRALALACMLQALQQLCGFNSLMYFSATLFAQLGFASPTLAALVVAASNFAFTFVASALVDRLGRRRILLCVMPVMAAALLAAAAAVSAMDLNDVRDPAESTSTSTSTTSPTESAPRLAPFLTLVFIAVYCAGYATSLGPIPWQQAELFPLRVRALGSGLATATNYTANFAVGASFLPLLDAVSAAGAF